VFGALTSSARPPLGWSLITTPRSAVPSLPAPSVTTFAPAVVEEEVIVTLPGSAAAIVRLAFVTVIGASV
jgi:hypothetical protein